MGGDITAFIVKKGMVGIAQRGARDVDLGSLDEAARRLATAENTIVFHGWERAGILRASVLKQRKKARVADALIAQSCLDQSTPLVTRDRDFRHFAAAAGLPLL